MNFLSGAPVDREDLAAMSAYIRHRGPDGDGLWLDRHVGLAHRRLSIIDLSAAGAQPMHSTDGRAVIVFNGEIYNYRDVRRQLESYGHRFQSHTDTEVILAAYVQFGDACVDHLVGMFAFAIWDVPRQRCLIARDRVGKKPLFYRVDQDGLAFASEVRAFFGERSFTARVNRQAIADYLSLQYVPTPHSAYEGVQKLPPGHLLIIEDGKVRTTRYWSLRYDRKLSISEDDAVDAVSAAIETAVKDRLVSDVPLGAFLSGGIDSGTIVAFMARHASEPVRTFSIGFKEEAYNELPAARLVAQRYGTRHEEFIVEPDAVSLLPRLVWHYGEPYADSSALPTFCLAELTRRHVTVALNGDGGDESFAGYTRYVANLAATRFDMVPASLRRWPARLLSPLAAVTGASRLQRALRFLERFADVPERRYAAWMLHFDIKRKTALCTPEFLSNVHADVVDDLETRFTVSSGPDLIDRMLDVDVHTYLLDDLLVKVDIATMAHSLEARSPLLDHRVMELAARLPSRYKLRQGRTKKHVLRRVAEPLLPAEILNRPKMGFGVPIEKWFRSELQTFARDVLLDPRALQRGYFRPEFVRTILDEHRTGRRVWHYQIWNLLMLELWHRQFIDTRPSMSPTVVQ